ncbi:DUF6772 family protein [Actinophytocola gossypii]|uniref:Uncharacterized protein n=1 Tax=Actinophytocola gossypii TaxID=2812003 RepID=A0ABT2JAH9_9PSEU|nr:DUF6772 family protein [Actinophytocola gossypii]MCT2584867.1 hypothetical protein [Actinophytocola gossypii]
MQRVISYERGLEKFNPLRKIVTYDDFDHGYNGWLDLTPNFVNDDYRHHPSEVDLASWAPTMISAAPMRFAATHGSMEGTYSLKLNTKPVANRYEEKPANGSMGVALKRLSNFDPTMRYIQMETWYAYTPQQDRLGFGEEDMRAFGFYFDLQDSEYRWMPGVRYVNSVNGQLTKKWQYWKVADGVTKKDWCYGREDGWQRPGIDNLWYGRRFPDGSADAFQWVPDGEQDLLYNESPDKINWLYLRLLVDYRRREYVELQSMDRTFDLRGLTPTLSEPYKSITNLINPIFFVETDTNRSVNLFLDSVVYSTD